MSDYIHHSLRLLLLLRAAASEHLSSEGDSETDSDRLEATSWSSHSTGAAHRRIGLPRDRVASGNLWWQKPVVKHLQAVCAAGLDCSSFDLYEFGVYTGRFMRGIARALNASHVGFRR